MESFGPVIRKLRQERGLTLKQLADMAGMDLSNLARKERGHLRFKAFEREKLAEAFGLPLEELHSRSIGAKGEKLPGLDLIPVLNVGPAGKATGYDDLPLDPKDHPLGIFEYVDRDRDTPEPDLFAIRMVGDSMFPQIREGDLLIFAEVEGVIEVGELALVQFASSEGKSQCAIGLWYWGDGPQGLNLKRTNLKYPTFTLPKDCQVKKFAELVQHRKTWIV